MSKSNGSVAHQFADARQQKEASSLGMWVFLLTEVMFFGGLFVSYAVYRSIYLPAFVAGSHHLDVFLGTVNTLILICSSFTMVLAVSAAESGKGVRISFYLLLTVLLGAVFLVIKGYEYWVKFQHHLVPGPHFQFDGPVGDNVQLFYSFYFAMTGLHAIHMIIGIPIICVIALMAWRGRFSQGYYNPVENIGLYWHFVDIIWIFLFPLLYLIGRH